MTGIPADTLRMWERRYRVVTPARSEGGYRLYDDAAIARLTAMHALVQAGWSPRRAAVQVASGTTLGPTNTSDVDPGADVADRTGEDLDLLVRLALEFDGQSLTRALDETFAHRDLEDLADSWLMPALTKLGQGWLHGEVSVAAEHFVTAGVQRRLASALDSAHPQPATARVLVGLTRGARHELGVLAFSAIAARAGLAVIYLGADVPPESWVLAATAREPSAIVLGVPTVEDVAPVRDTIAALAAATPDLPVLLGGARQELVGAGQPMGHSLAQAGRQLAERLRNGPRYPPSPSERAQ